MELLVRLRHAGLTVTRTGDQIVVGPRDLLTDELRVAIREAKPQLLSALKPTQKAGQHKFSGQEPTGWTTTGLSPVHESSRREVLTQLETHPQISRAFVNRFEPDGTMIVTLGIRGIGTGELRIPAARFSQNNLDDYAALLGTMKGTS